VAPRSLDGLTVTHSVASDTPLLSGAEVSCAGACDLHPLSLTLHQTHISMARTCHNICYCLALNASLTADSSLTIKLQIVCCAMLCRVAATGHGWQR